VEELLKLKFILADFEKSVFILRVNAVIIKGLFQELISQLNEGALDVWGNYQIVAL
jgi:hypothetical protein